MKKLICLVLCALLFCGYALADTEVQLPGTCFMIPIPEGMEYSEPEEDGQEIYAWFSDSLEIDYTSYPKAMLFQQGEEQTLRRLAETRIAAGDTVEIRDVNGIEMLVFRMTDEADGTPGIGYLFENGEWMAEIDFWYATQEAADLTVKIISGIYEGKTE